MLLFWDASALAKRYVAEEGSDTADALFASVPSHSMATTPWGYAETYSILLRRVNNKAIDPAAFSDSVTALQTEIADSSDFGMLPIKDETIFSSVSIMHKHNLNATDAAILTMLLGFLPSPPPSDFVLIAADKRLLRAADEEGMKTVDPALLSAADVPAFLAAL